MPKTADHAKYNMLSFEHFSPKQIIGGLKAAYPAAYDFTHTYEGGYVNDPDDPGGCTNLGVTIGTLQAWRNAPVTCTDVKNLTEQEAALIYATNYWSPVWGNKLPIGINTQVWDWGVNSGPHTSIKHLQEMVNSPADGAMGPNTLQAVANYIDMQGIDDTLKEYHGIRQDYYESLSTFSKYGNGWTNRNNDCLSLSLSLAHREKFNWPTPPIDRDTNTRLTALEEWASSYGT